MFVTNQERQSALGSFDDPKEAKFYQKMVEVFTPLEIPEPGDWLHGSKEVHQSYGNYKLPYYNPVTSDRRTIYIQQFDIFNEEFIEQLRLFCVLFYPEMLVKRLPVINFQKELRSIKKREGYYHYQYLAQDILAFMEKKVPKDAYCVMGITLHDIYPGDSWLFVYGWAKYKARVGIFSFLRFDDDFRRKKKEKIDWSLILYPSMRTMAHEIGHMFGVTHCVYYRCLMNGFNGIEENYQKPFQFCPICFRKISTNIAFNIGLRYKNLLKYIESSSQKSMIRKDQCFYNTMISLSVQFPFALKKPINNNQTKEQKKQQLNSLKQKKDTRIRQFSVKIPHQKAIGTVVKPNSNALTKNIKNMPIISPVIPLPKQIPIKRQYPYNRGQSMAQKSKK